MRPHHALALATLAFAFLAVPAAQADPLPLCYGDPCVEQGAGAGSGGADASVTVRALDGFGVAVHAGPDAVLVGVGVGITQCVAGLDLSPVFPAFGCAV